MRTSLLLLPLLALACDRPPDASSRAGLLAEDHAPLRSPCTTTDVPLMRGLRLACPTLPSSPELGDVDLWRGPLPSSSHWTRLDGYAEEGDETYDYSAPFTFSNATYRDDGNIESVTFPEVTPIDAPVVHYTYDGSTLVGAYIQDVGGLIHDQTEVIYEDGRRKYEVPVDDPLSQIEYTYDAEGRVVARIGGCARGQVPPLPDPAMLATACPTFDTPRPDPDAPGGRSCTVTYYFRDGDGRITNMLAGAVGGFEITRIDLTWDGDRLLRAERSCNSFRELGWRNERFDYTY